MSDFKQDVGVSVQYVVSALAPDGITSVDLATISNLIVIWDTDRPDVVTFDDKSVQNPDITLTTGIDDSAPATVTCAITGYGFDHSVQHTFSTNVVVSDPIGSIDFGPVIVLKKSSIFNKLLKKK